MVGVIAVNRARHPKTQHTQVLINSTLVHPLSYAFFFDVRGNLLYGRVERVALGARKGAGGA